MFRELHPAFQPWAQWAYEVAEYYRLSPRITSTFRSVAEQRSLVERAARGEPGIISPASPGCSQHNYGVAFDMATTDRGRTVGEVWQSVGGYWTANDYVHFGVKWFPSCPRS